jgi:hypothetical protein
MSQNVDANLMLAADQFVATSLKNGRQCVVLIHSHSTDKTLVCINPFSALAGLTLNVRAHCAVTADAHIPVGLSVGPLNG